MTLFHMRPGHIEFLENYALSNCDCPVFFLNSMRLGFNALLYLFHYVSVYYQFESTSYTTRHNISLSIVNRPCDILEYHTNGRPIPRSACFQFYALCPVNCNFSFTYYILGCAWNARPFILGLKRIRILFLLRHTFKEFLFAIRRSFCLSTFNAFRAFTVSFALA